VDEAARAALASVLGVGEEVISSSSSATGNLWSVEYALVGTYPEMLVARDATQGLMDGSGLLEAALDGALSSRSLQLVPGSVLAGRGEVVIGTYPLTSTLTSTSTVTSYAPSASQLGGEGSQEASTVVIVIVLLVVSIGGFAVAACFALLRRRRRAAEKREKDTNGFDSISPSPAWGLDDVVTVSVAPPLNGGHHQDRQPGHTPEFHLTW